MFGLGMQELIVIFLIILLLFGASRLPELAKGMGKAIREFKKAMEGEYDEDKSKKKGEDVKSKED